MKRDQLLQEVRRRLEVADPERADELMREVERHTGQLPEGFSAGWGDTVLYFRTPRNDAHEQNVWTFRRSHPSSVGAEGPWLVRWYLDERERERDEESKAPRAGNTTTGEAS